MEALYSKSEKLNRMKKNNIVMPPLALYIVKDIIDDRYLF